jgi:hypothetical protein
MPTRITQHRLTTENYGLRVAKYEGNGRRFARARFYKLNRYGFITTWHKLWSEKPTEIDGETSYQNYVMAMQSELQSLENEGDHTANVLARIKDALGM